MSSSHSLRWLWGLGAALALVLSLPMACSTPQLGLNLYQFKAGAVTIDELGSAIKSPTEISADDATTGLLNLQTSDNRLPQFGCKELLKQLELAKKDASSPTSTFGLVPTLLFNGFAKGKLALVGRFPVDVACSKLKAAVFMAPPATISSWRPMKDERSTPSDPSFGRVGHRFVRLPDGRYLLTGGVTSLPYDDKGLPQIRNVVSQSLVFDPSTGALSDGPKLKYPRAFHVAAVVEGKLVVLGGLSQGGELAPNEVFSLPQLEALSDSELPEAVKNLTPRAFQTLIRVPEAGGSVRYAQVGGISCPIKDMSAECKGDQLLYHATVLMPERQTVILIGGMRFEKIGGRWQVNREIQSFRWDRLDSSTFVLNDAGVKLDLFPPRIAHTAVRVSKSRVWIFGGILPKEGSLTINDATGAKAVNYLDIDEQGRITFKNISFVGTADQYVRVFANALPVDDKRFLVSGGLDSLPNDKGQGATFAKEALVLQLDPDDPSGSSLQINSIGQRDRIFGQVALLPTGQHLILGGLAGSGFAPVEQSELYNPAPGVKIGSVIEAPPVERSPPEPSGEKPTQDAGPQDKAPRDAGPQDAGPQDKAPDKGSPDGGAKEPGPQPEPQPEPRPEPRPAPDRTPPPERSSEPTKE